MGSDELYNDVLANAAGECGVELVDLPDGLFVNQRMNEKVIFTFYINITSEPIRVNLILNGYDVIAEQRVSNEAIIKGYNVLIVRSTR